MWCFRTRNRATAQPRNRATAQPRNRANNGGQFVVQPKPGLPHIGSMSPKSAIRGSGFTLIELLVVIAVIGIL